MKKRVKSKLSSVKKHGGHGAVREVIDWLTDITGKKNEMLKLYEEENIS